MKTLKPYSANRGVPLDASWISHVASCEQCRLFDAEKPATASNLCLEGSVLYKRDNAVVERRTPAERGPTYATKAEMKRLTRYKD